MCQKDLCQNKMVSGGCQCNFTKPQGTAYTKINLRDLSVHAYFLLKILRLF